MDSKDCIIPEISIQDGVKGREVKCKEYFIEKFKTEPLFYVRVPGRVNLIGEHIDYCGYGVFPMAIQQDVLLGGRGYKPTNQGTPILRLINVDPKYESFECNLQDIKYTLMSRAVNQKPNWYLYFLCGIQGILDHFQLFDNSNHEIQSMEICMDGIVPPSAGLSSSSATVCAAAVATLKINQLRMKKDEMASLCAKSERYIGTEGGGMDQAIAMLAEKGTAQLIEFVPSLHGEQISLPPSGIFVISNCLSEANKASTSYFNTRVAECRLATWILAKKLTDQNYENFQRFRELGDYLKLNPAQLLEKLNEVIKEGVYTALEISKILEVSVDELAQKPLMNKIPFKNMEFRIYDRAFHVFNEADRVYKFKSACADGNLKLMGRLMTESHQSLKDIYECSHPMLDSLVDISIKKTYGARLTGAGWGGCIVALVDSNQLDAYLEALKIHFYFPNYGLTELDSNHVFITTPGQGAAIFINN